ncbi:SDR family NAD(P)-dependent oxidoreductase [Paraflavitalea sp. CAU 1676]|uniref:SDR family NAD(P)-dependent oxidoreductase n=1 Tax=Paraflavitalea sp. CAU 1676 TaxID=3032598 RepID=UPI0023D97959|nr:SDR family NAD(P)-dependent oxidoreductase [Paraflavitalea sp. CAU 1676]MDF2192233.1 SDR family NAD(P)-dependent oxidoreductase [Paraflavitalea sp. CAU 1676]
MSSPIALITGATSGFGKAIAIKFASNRYNLVITGRRAERLQELKDTLTSTYGVEVIALSFDVRSKKAAFDAIDQLPAAWKAIDVLVNNAGLALGRDYFDEASIEDWDTMIDTNVKGLLYMSKAVIPSMIERRQGHIINIGSTAGKEVYEKGNTYCATKYAVNALSQAMRIDLLRHRIKVTVIHPGAADTEFSNVRFKGDGDQAKKVYEGYDPLTAGDVADVVYYTTTLPAHVCINDLVMTCTAQANSMYLFKDH